MQNNCAIESEAAQDGALAPLALGDSHEVNLIELLTQLALRKWLIAKVTGIAFLAGVLLSLLLPVQYKATTKLMPPQQTQSAASMVMNQLAAPGGGSLAAIAGGGLGLKSPNDIYIGLLTSRPIADAIIQEFDLTRVYNVRDMFDARKKLAGDTDISTEKNGFISISVTGKDKRLIARIANAYTEQLRTLTKTLAVTEASQRRLFYEDQLKQARDALVSAEIAFQQVQQNRGVVELDAQAKATIESLTELQAQVAAQQVQVQMLRSYSTEENPDLKLAERELATLQDEAIRLEQRSHTSGFGEIGLQDVPSAGLEYLRAEREVRYRQTLFDMLMKQYEAARLDEAKDATIVQVVETAIEPGRKTSPRRALIALLFTIVGVFSGSFLALMLWWNELAHTDAKLSAQLRDLRRAVTGS